MYGTHTMYPANHVLYKLRSVTKRHSSLLHLVWDWSWWQTYTWRWQCLEVTSTQFPAHCLERLLGQDVVSWLNRSHPVAGGHLFRALCSCWVPHTSAPTGCHRVSYLLWKAGENSSAEIRKWPWAGSSVEKDSRADLRDVRKPCLWFSRRRVSPVRVRLLPGPLGQGSLQHVRLCRTWKRWLCPARVFQQRQRTPLTAFFQT